MTTYTQQNHSAPLARSNSFLGTIKNIVTAPFTWFAGSEDEFEDANGKRRRLQVVPESTQLDDESVPSKAKRMRVDSPDRESQPYLDPPRSAFPQPRRFSERSTSSTVRDITRSPRRTLHIPSTSSRLPHNRRTVSPLPSGSLLKLQGIARTMSLDPPSNLSLPSRMQAAAAAMDAKSEPNHGGHPTSRDVSMSPRHLRVRSSLTPQPSGTIFGPIVPPRRERGPDEPPPLTALMSNPMFVKPPPAAQKQDAVESHKHLTLGTMLDSQRSTRPLARQGSSILFGTGAMTDVSAPGHRWPVNKAEVALHELEVYKTPLLPTRLKGATAVPDMFLHKEKKHITLMTDDRPAKPRLGTKSKGKEKGWQKERETMNGTKPYAGEGGMKKWLARRKKEEEEAREKERAEAMEDERAEEERKRKEAEAEKKRREEELKVPPPPPPAPAFEPRVSREGPLSSSLRVGRTRTGRNHIERPVSRRAQFSAAFEDEDEDMEDSRVAEQKVLEDAAKKAPAFEIPTGFTFAKEATISHDLTCAKEPPISSLPFSLTKPTPTPPTAEIVKAAPILVPPTPAPAQPKILLVPPTPESVKAVAEAPTLPGTVAATSSATPTGIPNFFTNSSVFAKSTAVTTPSSSSLTVPAVEESKATEVPKLDVSKPADAIPPLFGAPSQPRSAFAAPASDSVPASSTFGAPSTLRKEAEKPTTATPFTALPFTFGAPANPVEPVSVPTPLPSKQSSTREAAQPTIASNGAPFTFGTSPPSTSPAPATISTPAAPTAPAATVEPSKSVFTFGHPAAATASASAPAPVIGPPAADTPKSIFGTPPPATPFSFGQPPSTTPVEGKPATSPFSFGASSAVEKKPATGFSFGSSTASTAAPAASTTLNFGATPSGTTAADVSSKSFTFAPTTPARPVTPPKAVQEVTMDESPARDMALNGNGSGKAPERLTLNFSFNTPSGSALFAQSPATTTAPFSFGASGAATNPFAKEEKKEPKLAGPFSGFGQAPSSGFSFGPKPPESPAVTTPAPAFSFTQPSPNVAPPSPFSFGAAPASANPFGQPSTASAPSSPSTFNRPASFTFGTPTTTQPTANPFGFGAGSQPASPAAGSTTLPSGTTSSGPFAFGGTASSAAAPGFGVAAPVAAPARGSLFTMGSAPPPTDGAGSRRIKGLPRRGARR